MVRNSRLNVFSFILFHTYQQLELILLRQRKLPMRIQYTLPNVLVKSVDTKLLKSRFDLR